MPLLLALSVLLTPTVARAAEKLDASAQNALLARLEQARDQTGGGMSATFTETKVSRLLQTPLVTEGTVRFQAPDHFRREVSGNDRSLSVSDGKTLWIFYPNFNEVEIYALGQKSVFDDALAALTAGLSYSRMREFYNIEAWRESAGYRLELTPRKRNVKRLMEKTILFLNEALEPTRTEVLLPKGDRLVTEYHNVKRAAQPRESFQFTPPAGATISRPMGK